jgi:hypothetical protein
MSDLDMLIADIRRFIENDRNRSISDQIIYDRRTYWGDQLEEILEVYE